MCCLQSEVREAGWTEKLYDLKFVDDDRLISTILLIAEVDV